MSITKNVFKINDIHDRVVAGTWIPYNLSNDPGTIWSWGSSLYGFLGDNTAIGKSSPIQIPGTTWTSLRPGRVHTLATKSDGSLWA